MGYAAYLKCQVTGRFGGDLSTVEAAHEASTQGEAAGI